MIYRTGVIQEGEECAMNNNTWIPRQKQFLWIGKNPGIMNISTADEETRENVIKCRVCWTISIPVQKLNYRWQLRCMEPQPTFLEHTDILFLVFDLWLTMKRKFKLLPDIIKVCSADKWIKDKDNSLTNADNFSRDAGQVYKQVNKSILKTILQKLPTEFLAAQTSRFGNRWRWQRYFRQDVALRGKAWVKSARSSEWLSAGT